MVFLKNKKGQIIVEQARWTEDEEVHSVYIKKGSKAKERVISMGSNQSDISCGIDMAHGFPTNTKMNEIINIIQGSVKTKKAEKEMLDNLLSRMFKPMACRFIMLSDTKSSGKTIMHEMLDRTCNAKSRWAKNPNSGNQIRVWIYKK